MTETIDYIYYSPKPCCNNNCTNYNDSYSGNDNFFGYPGSTPVRLHTGKDLARYRCCYGSIRQYDGQWTQSGLITKYR